MTRRARRPLSAEERRLWAEVVRSVAPLGRSRPEEEPEPVGATVESVPAKPGTGTKAPAPTAPRIPAPPPLVALERRTARALARGQTQAEATLDLHGLTQAQAHLRLLGFLRRAQASGFGLVLVVTGRGREGADGAEGRGVLRRVVPHWLGLPDLRPIVLGFQEAGTRQGGAGALYVRLRRSRG